MEEDEIKAEGLTEILPKRRNKGGKRPGSTTRELTWKLKQGEEAPCPGLWASTNPDEQLDKRQKRTLLPTTVRLLIILIFSNHIYQFEGIDYQQLLGGSIGLRLTSVVARVVMDRWAREFLGRLDRAGLSINAFMKYIDDLNLVMQKVALGTRGHNGKMEMRN